MFHRRFGVASLCLLLAAACDEPVAEPGPADGAVALDPEPAPEPEPEPESPPDSDAVPEPEPEPDAASEPEPDAGSDPWPEPLPAAMPGLTVVYDGRVLAAGQTLRIDGPPAGLDHPVVIELILVWRGAQPIAWADAPEDWLSAPGFGWRTPPPARLEPEATARIELVFDPAIAATAGLHRAGLVAPGTDFALDVEIELRRPLRMVVVGSDGRTLVSDAYGAELSPGTGPVEPSARHTIAWGAGRFFRSWATGGEWQDPGAYAYSDDGLEWTSSTAAAEFWASGCAYGVDRFACAVGDRFAWSMNGAGVVHEATAWQGMLHALHFAGDRFVAVGRGGRRAVSFDGVAWAHDSGDGGLPDGVDDDWFFAVTARPEGDWIAVGGQNSTITAHSPDGVAWSLARAPGARGSYSVACLPGRCLRDSNGGESPLYASADGIDWRPVAMAEPRNLYLLGTVNGWFVAADNPWQQPGALYRSRDGGDWDLLHRAEQQVHWVSMAAERWEPSR